MLNMEKKVENNALYIALEGQLDTLSVPGVEAELKPLMAEVTSVTIDLEKLDYMSSAGLRVLLAIQQVMEEKDAEPVKVINSNATIREVFEMTGFDSILTLE